jgi:hypothetical protein
LYLEANIFVLKSQHKFKNLYLEANIVCLQKPTYFVLESQHISEEGVYNVDKSVSQVKSMKEQEEDIKFIKLKSYEGINESNLMTIPFVSFSKAKVKTIERTWVRSNGDEVGIKVVGGEHGCPTMSEMDVLLALLRIMIRDNGNGYTYNKSQKQVSLNKVINFTYSELAKELGYAKFGGQQKRTLEKSMKILVETTIYSNFAIRDIEQGEYIADFKGEESCNILTHYKSYSMARRKRAKQNFADHKEVRECTSVEIDDFFFNNMCNNYFKIYDFKKYMSLNDDISKKLFLILSHWSHGYQKFISYRVLYDYIGLDVPTADKAYYYNRKLRASAEKFKAIGFINDFELRQGEGINFIFNLVKLNRSKFKDRYLTIEDIYTRLRELGFSLDEFNIYVRLDNEPYVSALLRYIDDKTAQDHTIHDLKAYVEEGLKYENYDVHDYEI